MAYNPVNGLTTDVDVIVDLADRPNITAAALKAAFDQAGVNLKADINVLVANLNAAIAAAFEGEFHGDDILGGTGVSIVPVEGGRVRITLFGEADRVAAEISRVSAEQSRTSAEQSRVDAEALRAAGCSFEYAGSHGGLVPRRDAGDTTSKYLREDGAWTVPPDTNTAAADEIAVLDARGYFAGESVEAVLQELGEKDEAQSENLAAHGNALVTSAGGAHGLIVQSGAWTPVFKGFETAGSFTYSKQAGMYYKIGAMVHIAFDVRISNITALPIGYFFLDALPFACALINNITHFPVSVCVSSGGVSDSFRKIIGADIADTQIQLKALNTGLIDNATSYNTALAIGANNVWIVGGGWYISE